eukprot:SAG31_NODE_29455_length_395_cov_0.702703_1_plen_75_part_01
MPGAGLAQQRCKQVAVVGTCFWDKDDKQCESLDKTRCVTVYDRSLFPNLEDFSKTTITDCYTPSSDNSEDASYNN